MKITIINGPNLNLTGTREPGLYGNQGFAEFIPLLREKFSHITIEYFQSNVEGEIINRIQEAAQSCTGIILNAGGYSHTSVAIADAVAAIRTPVIEVHISNVFAREQYRQVSLTGAKTIGSISGFGLYGYQLALQYFSEH